MTEAGLWGFRQISEKRTKTYEEYMMENSKENSSSSLLDHNKHGGGTNLIIY